MRLTPCISYSTSQGLTLSYISAHAHGICMLTGVRSCLLIVTAWFLCWLSESACGILQVIKIQKTGSFFFQLLYSKYTLRLIWIKKIGVIYSEEMRTEYISFPKIRVFLYVAVHQDFWWGWYAFKIRNVYDFKAISHRNTALSFPPNYLTEVHLRTSMADVARSILKGLEAPSYRVCKISNWFSVRTIYLSTWRIYIMCPAFCTLCLGSTND